MNSVRRGDDGEGTTHQDEEPHKEQASPLTIPPDSEKQEKGKVRPMVSKGKSKQTPPFRNPIITKPSTTREKETVRGSYRSDSIISHQGWRFTEEGVKSTSVVLAKTTMEQLASFRFKPPSDPQATHVSHLPLPHVSSEMLVDELSPEPLQETAGPSSDYDLPIEDSFFNKAPWAVKAHAQFNGNDQIQAEPTAKPSPVPVDSKMNFQQGERIVGSGIPNSLREKSSIEVGRTGSVSARCHSHGPAHLMEPGDDTANPYYPTSSEFRAFDDLRAVEADAGKFAQGTFDSVDPLPDMPIAPESQSRDAEKTERGSHSVAGKPQNRADQLLVVYAPNQRHGVESHRPADRSAHHHTDSEIHNGEVHHVLPVDQDATSTCQSNDHHELPKQKIPQTHEGLRGCKTDIQVEQLDIDESETPSKEAYRDLWRSDEFDQGLDEDDLLALVLDAAVPQTPVYSQPDRQKNPRVCGRFLLSFMPARPDSHSRDTLTLQNPTIGHIINHNSSSLRLVPNLDDEYPMDDGDEEEMLKLSELGAAVKESFVPPESVQKAFDDLVDGEVYDSSLQFSPPKLHESSTSPSKVTRGYNTDKTRISRSPGLLKDLLPLGEEEDWSFIRSDEHAEAETMSGPFCHPQSAGTRTAEQCQTLSSTFTRRSAPDHARVQNLQTLTTQMTSDTSWSIIDDSHEYEPLNPFARPDFPVLVLDHSPVVGFSGQTYLRTCFRIGEMFKEGARCASLSHDAVIELFARVTFSSREPGSTKQHLQFADLWHDRPPYPNGLLANYKTTELADSESKVFLSENGKMARCLGRFKRDVKNSVWVLHIINIRETDWEEIRWTKEIVSHGQVKTKNGLGVSASL